MRGSNREVSWPDTDRGPVPRDEKRPGDPPLYVSTPEHVTAHLLICMIALILMRIIQKRIRESGSVAIDPDAYWSSGLNAGRIQTALNKWKVDLLPGDLYRFMDADDPDLKLILVIILAR